MTDHTAEPWHLAPVSNAFDPCPYPPNPIVHPEHVGYAVQRYLPPPGMMGEVLKGYWRLPEAERLCALLNTAPDHPEVRHLPRRRTYL